MEVAMIRRDEYADLSDFELAVEHVLVCAELALREAQELHRHGYVPVEVLGLPSVLWRSPNGCLYTTAAALEATTPPKIIPEQEGGAE
jgi:hypothetical protein